MKIQYLKQTDASQERQRSSFYFLYPLTIKGGNIAVKLFKRSLIASLLSGALIACGGGGGGGGGSETTPPPPPPQSTFTIGGTASGVNGSGLVLQNNGGDNLPISTSGGFTFATEVNDGTSYNVIVSAQPVNPNQNCNVTNGSGTATDDVTNVTVSCVDIVASADTDDDGLTDAEEINIYGTSPFRKDTDGDGYDDFEEIITFGFNAATNPYRYNPLIADFARFQVDILEVPVIGANFADTNGTNQEVSTSRSASQTLATSAQYGISTTVGVEATSSATVGASATGPSAEVSASVSVSASTTMSYDVTNTQENQQAWESMQAQGIEQSSTTDGGFIRVRARIRNTGPVPLTLESMSLKSDLVTDGDDPFQPGPLLNSDGVFPSTDLAPENSGSSSPSFIDVDFENTAVNTGEIRDLLNGARTIRIDQREITVRDATGTSLPYREALVNPVTAKILIDYGPYAESELYQVATILDNTQNPGRPLPNILTETLQIPYEQDGNGITTIRGIDSPAGGRWVVTTKRRTGTDTETTFYDANTAPYSIDTLIARGEDEILFVLLEDPDGDGLGYREELIHGTNPNVADTDGDGLTDFEEVRQSWTVTAIRIGDPNRYPDEVFSSPISADYDEDGLNDADERANGLDPYENDTDGDGESDLTDRNNGSEPLTAIMPLFVGSIPGGGVPHSDYAVDTGGAITAADGEIVENATLSWGDGSADIVFGPFTGNNPTLNIPLQRHIYPEAAGSYVLMLTADDSAGPENTLMETATLVLTEPVRPYADSNEFAFSYRSGYYTNRHVRTLADIDGNGFDDLVVTSDTVTLVAEGTATGLMPAEIWADSFWRYGDRTEEPQFYADVNAEPRRLVHIDNDQNLDIVGVNVTTLPGVSQPVARVEYGRNNGLGFGNGGGFEDPVILIADLMWDEDRDEMLYADINGDGFTDFLHVSAQRAGIVPYTSNGASLLVSERTPLSFPSLPAGQPAYPDRDSYRVYAEDLDGDGNVDLTLYGNDGTYVAKARGDGEFEFWTLVYDGYGFADGYDNATDKRWVDDINGDQKPDLVTIGQTTVEVILNTSIVGTIQFEDTRRILTDNFTAQFGYKDDGVSRGAFEFNVFPRYLADVNGDGYKDIVAFAGVAAAIGINRLGIDGEFAIESARTVASEFSIDRVDDNDVKQWVGEDDTSCELVGSPCREFFPRLVGDIDGDGRADLLGFDRVSTVFQSVPYITQFD